MTTSKVQDVILVELRDLKKQVFDISEDTSAIKQHLKDQNNKIFKNCDNIEKLTKIYTAHVLETGNTISRWKGISYGIITLIGITATLIGIYVMCFAK